MFFNKQHKTILIQVLKKIYGHPFLRNILEFKGGTAAMIFYDLPRLSVDLDFDLLDSTSKDKVFQIFKEMLPKFGELKEAVEKRYTLFFLISYQKAQRKAKVEISKRPLLSHFEIKYYLGIPILTMKKEDMFASKLAAFLTRKRLASRDIFDLWFFFNKQWDINETVFKDKTKLPLKEGLITALDKLKKVPTRQLLQGLGDLLETNKQKDFVRKKLKEELSFYLRLASQELKEK